MTCANLPVASCWIILLNTSSVHSYQHEPTQLHADCFANARGHTNRYADANARGYSYPLAHRDLRRSNCYAFANSHRYALRTYFYTFSDRDTNIPAIGWSRVSLPERRRGIERNLRG
jgi:hypothetical protein